MFNDVAVADTCSDEAPRTLSAKVLTRVATDVALPRTSMFDCKTGALPEAATVRRDVCPGVMVDGWSAPVTPAGKFARLSDTGELKFVTLESETSIPALCPAKTVCEGGVNRSE